MQTLTQAHTFEDVVKAVEDQDALNFDLTTSLNDLTVTDAGTVYDQRSETVLGFTPMGLSQFARKIELPGPYSARILAENPELFARNVRHGISNNGETDPSKDLLFRCTTEDGVQKIRAVLTSRYGILDNAPALEALLDAFRETGLDDLHIEGYSLDAASFHLRLGDKKRAIDAAKAAGYNSLLPAGVDILYPMLHNFNSEVGVKSYGLYGGTYRVICANGAVRPNGDEMGFKKRHFGYTTQELTQFVVESAENILRGAESFTHKFAESQNILVPYAETMLKNLFGRTRVSRKDEKAVLAELAAQFNTTELDETPVTQYDVVNAITATARMLPADDRVTLERIAASLVQ
jgi:hypothetical protein